MLAIYLIQKYLNKLTDTDFLNKWENHFITYAKRYFLGAMFYFVLVVSALFAPIITEMNSIFGGLLMMFFITTVYGYYFLKWLVRFIGVNNSRFLSLKMGNPTDTFNKDNVVG
jgi:hypothetical protein